MESDDIERVDDKSHDKIEIEDNEVRMRLNLIKIENY